MTVNAELVNVYWQTGAIVSTQRKHANWGDGTVEQLSEYIQDRNPGTKGFDLKNIYRMAQFYDAWTNVFEKSQTIDNENTKIVATVWRQLEGMKNDEIVATLWRQFKNTNIRSTPLVKVNWSIHKMLIGRCKLPEEMEFYLHLAIRERLSVRELHRQISSAVFERTMNSGNAYISKELSKRENIRLAFKDRYVFDFLNLSDTHSERELQTALIAQMKHFILELGKDFLFVGQEFRVQVGMADYYIDLVFYHRELQCLVAVELKTNSFQPTDKSQLEFYLTSLDKDVRKPHEKQSIGILLCKDKDPKVVEYTMSTNSSPMLIAEYLIALPKPNVLQSKLLEFYNNTPDQPSGPTQATD